MTTGNWVIASPLLVILIFTIWYFLPICVYIFFPNSVRSYFKENDNSIITEREDLQNIISKIKALGFEYIGIKVEKPPLWRAPIQEIALGSIEALSFASVFYRGKKVVYYFFTPFHDGQIVLTANMGFSQINQDDVIQFSTAIEEPSKSLEEHKKNIVSFIVKGYSPFTEYTEQTRIDATNLYYKSKIIKSQMQTRGVTALVLLLIATALFFLSLFR
jgi:hypothetical protein